MSVRLLIGLLLTSVCLSGCATKQVASPGVVCFSAMGGAQVICGQASAVSDGEQLVITLKKESVISPPSKID